MLALESATTARALATLIVVEVLVRTSPLPRVGRLLGCDVDVESHLIAAERLAPVDLTRRHRRQLRCAHRLARAWPFSDGPCLRRALVDGHLLRELNPSVRLGLIGSGSDLSAHAWLEIGGRPLEDVGAYRAFEQIARRDGS
jgi:hypothetical protein